MSCDPRDIQCLRQHSEDTAKYLRWASIVLIIPALILLLIVAVLPLSIVVIARLNPGFPELDIKWAILILSELVIPAAFLIFVSRLTWDYSNVWLGRAGTLEDLSLALTLIGVNPERLTPLSNEQAEKLLLVTQAIERHRRTFEGDLLKGPSFEVKLPKA